MKKSIMALEGIEEEVIEEVPTEEQEVNLSEVEEASADIDETQGIVDEATDIHETMGEMADALETPAEVPAEEVPPVAEVAPVATPVEGQTAEEAAAAAAKLIVEAAVQAEAAKVIAAVAEPKEVSPETAEVVSIAVEHFCRRLGYKRKAMTTALEDFGTSKKANGALISQMRIAQEEVAKRLVIAQEGLWARIKHRFSLMFTHSEKIKANLKVVSAAYDTKGPKEGTLEKPGFSKYLNPKNKSTLTGKDVINELSGLANLINDEKLAAIIKNIETGMEKILVSKAKAGSTEYVSILKEQAKLVEIGMSVTKEYSVTKKGTDEADIEVLSSVDKAKLVKVIESILDNTSAAKALDNIYKLYSGDEQIGDSENDAKNQANQSYKALDETWNTLAHLYYTQEAWAHAAVAYIKASTK